MKPEEFFEALAKQGIELNETQKHSLQLIFTN